MKSALSVFAIVPGYLLRKLGRIPAGHLPVSWWGYIAWVAVVVLQRDCVVVCHPPPHGGVDLSSFRDLDLRKRRGKREPLPSIGV